MRFENYEEEEEEYYKGEHFIIVELKDKRIFKARNYSMEGDLVKLFGAQILNRQTNKYENVKASIVFIPVHSISIMKKVKY